MEHLLGPTENDIARNIHWEAIVAALLTHQRSLRIAFRLNVLLGSFLNQAPPPPSRPGTQGSASQSVAASDEMTAAPADLSGTAEGTAGEGGDELTQPDGDAFVLGKRLTNSLDQARFRIFLHECGLLIPGKGGRAVSSVDADEIFRLASATELDAVGAPIAGGYGMEGQAQH